MMNPQPGSFPGCILGDFDDTIVRIHFDPIAAGDDTQRVLIEIGQRRGVGNYRPQRDLGHCSRPDQRPVSAAWMHSALVPNQACTPMIAGR